MSTASTLRFKMMATSSSNEMGCVEFDYTPLLVKRQRLLGLEEPPSDRPAIVRKFLIADDDRCWPDDHVRLSMEPIFQIKRWDVTFAEDINRSAGTCLQERLVLHALQMLQENAYQLVFIDGLKGYGERLVRQIRSHSLIQNIWIVAMSIDDALNNNMVIAGADASVSRATFSFMDLGAHQLLSHLRVLRRAWITLPPHPRGVRASRILATETSSWSRYDGRVPSVNQSRS